jgi:hypothetical protein
MACTVQTRQNISAGILYLMSYRKCRTHGDENLDFSWRDVCDERRAGPVHDHVPQVVEQLPGPVLYTVGRSLVCCYGTHKFYNKKNNSYR